MRVDVLLEDVARNLRVRFAVIRRIIGEPVRDGDAKACRQTDQD